MGAVSVAPLQEAWGRDLAAVCREIMGCSTQTAPCRALSEPLYPSCERERHLRGPSRFTQARRRWGHRVRPAGPLRARGRRGSHKSFQVPANAEPHLLASCPLGDLGEDNVLECPEGLSLSKQAGRAKEEVPAKRLDFRRVATKKLDVRFEVSQVVHPRALVNAPVGRQG